MSIPEPSCPHGYTHDDLMKIFPTYDERQAFNRWMRGQTIMVCDGHEYNYETKQYVETVCRSAPHGTVVYQWDVMQYLKGGKPLD